MTYQDINGLPSSKLEVPMPAVLPPKTSIEGKEKDLYYLRSVLRQLSSIRTYMIWNQDDAQEISISMMVLDDNMNYIDSMIMGLEKELKIDVSSTH